MTTTVAAAAAAAAAAAESLHVPPPLNIGDKCMVKWREGQETLLAKVIERRTPKKRKQDDTIRSDSNEEFQYYVHYESHDRRLDEWVSLDKFLLETYQPKSEQLESQQEETARPQRRVANEHAPIRLTGGNWHASGDPTLAELEREHEEITKVKNISKIIMGGWEVEAWYFSPYPEDYANCETLFICEYCLKYMKSVRTFHNHKACCEVRKPPGKEIYRHDNISAFEVDGKDSKVYCQNLCLLAKLFLDHKTLYFDTDPFLFYIICQIDEYGAHIVGYFSKEKVSAEDYNLACILTFPQHQKCGYGKFIISLSYELTKREDTTGSPEKPLSDLGKISYRSYWTHVLFGLLKKGPSQDLTIKSMSQQTGIKQEDIISTLQSLGMIRCFRSQHVIYVQQRILDEYKKSDDDFLFCHSEYLKWEPPTKKS